MKFIPEGSDLKVDDYDEVIDVVNDTSVQLHTANTPWTREYHPEVKLQSLNKYSDNIEDVLDVEDFFKDTNKSVDKVQKMAHERADKKDKVRRGSF